MNLLSFLKAAINGAWRRRVLMATPLVIVIPLSLAAAFLWPPKYETNTLILLQEYNGLSSDVPAYVRAQDTRDKIKSLEALVRSEFIMRRIWKQFTPGGADKEPTDNDLHEYRKRLTISQEGTQFVLLSLTGDKREGLSNELSAIVATLFESLLSSNNTSLNAPTFLRRTRQNELALIEERLTNAASPADNATLASLADKRAALARATDEKNQIDATLQRDRAILNERLDTSPSLNALKNNPIGDIISRLRQDLQSLQSNQDATVTNSGDRTARIIELEQTISAAEKVGEADRARAEIIATERQIRADLTRSGDLAAQRLQLQKQADDIRARYGATQGNNPPTSVGADIQLLAAPAQIQVIDTPKDPQRPMGSKLKILFAGIAAAIAMSLGFGILAEQLDGRLRGANMLRASTNLPVIAQFNDFALSVSAAPARSTQTGNA